MYSMAWIGKVLGALIGYALARLPGAIIGLIIGHQFDRGLSVRGVRRRSGAGAWAGKAHRSAERQRAFFETTFIVMGHLAKVDGRVSEVEIGAAREVMRRLRLGERETLLAMELFNYGKRPDCPVAEHVERLRRECASQPQLLYTFLEIEMDFALVKGAMTPAERELLGRVAEGLGMGQFVLLRLEALLRARRRFQESTAQPRETALEKAYAVLGITASATDREVKTAYRRLMNEHHPDKQIARGLPESMLEMAKERTSEIRAAYETIRENRGFR
jgi:DnaJ like chaperone protein